MERQQITFDTFVRGLIGVIIVVGIIMLLNRLSSVLTPSLTSCSRWSSSSSTAVA